MRIALRRASGIAAAAALCALIGTTPASAATGVGVVELSDDGVSFARTYPGAIFDSIALLSPGDSQSETIYVRNTGTATGYLRITMQDVTYSDSTYANALTVTTSTPSLTGSRQAISGASPCLVTHEGLTVSPGQTVPVTATLNLGDLSGSQGQGATASVSLRFTLSDTTPGTLPATQCENSGSTVPLTPTTPDSTDTNGTTNVVTRNSSTGTAAGLAGATPAPLATPTPSPSPSVVDTGSGLAPTFPTGFTLDPNSWRLYQEYLVLILFLAALIGAGISWLVGRRTRKETDDV
ncbi:hypothetical protein [Salinibacterium sp. NK8237]|uniref:hypothetical protein n=1 Tax=Salinibacterium sp. NK8237 TaxID=2792038 RepID=UPI0018CF0A05|nr:hypothetical protein [Salinibacterium sp. NK8237]MBH0129958.1 hypothetical protein [Salinibacterium sp. NK8237]